MEESNKRKRREKSLNTEGTVEMTKGTRRANNRKSGGSWEREQVEANKEIIPSEKGIRMAG